MEVMHLLPDGHSIILTLFIGPPNYNHNVDAIFYNFDSLNKNCTQPYITHCNSAHCHVSHHHRH